MTEPEAPTSDVERAASPDAVATLVAGYSDFRRFLERRVGSQAVAEDILHEAFSRSLQRIDELRSGDSVTAWFYRTLRNAVIDHFRRQGVSERAMSALSAELDEAVAPDVEATRAAVCQCVRGLAGALKPEYAAALQRVEVDGLSVQAFAEEASISANNAAVRLFRAREALRKRVAATCGACADEGCLDCSCEPLPADGAAEHAGGCAHRAGR
ncbi:DNA-directed RNA polymerase sigma-70 factor [Sorangium cellulosum]|uniref:DNA-directed RNA polymerase sigma-70 factor n=1 Tax=Sorangium cellulosum TaxID=56 RepID=A0A2L0EJC0_SORCE|nr:sigma-70 family RNA polymerase sigma factor [Sorangium cellulosum]AUX39387.1 DNA-directed RNA polymerase sigma-70 factor [Sorangium cellulosum]